MDLDEGTRSTQCHSGEKCVLKCNPDTHDFRLILAEFIFSKKMSDACHLTFINDCLIDGLTVHLI